MIKDSQSLLQVAEEFTFQYGIGVIPINDLKQPVIEKVIDKRGRVATREELEDYFAPNGIKRAQFLAVLLDSPKPLVALDLDGNGLAVFEKKVLLRCSEGLKIAINTTMRTKTPSNGLHIIFGIKSEDFPTGVRTREYWSGLGNGKRHNQINLMGTGYYLIERGPNYESINDPECLVTLSKKQVEQLLNILGQFESETMALKKVCSQLIQYYRPTNRQNIALRVPGYIHKHGVPEYLIYDLIEHLIQLAGGDEESEMRYQAIRNTCAKDANTEKVSGRTKLLEAVDGDESVITTINQEFGKLGYPFSSSGNGSGNESGTKPGPKQKPEEGKRQRFEYVQKYSNDRLLAEAVIIGGKPCFAVVNTEDGRITMEEEIPLNDSSNTVLKAPDISSYINKPYSFASVTEFEDCLQKAKHETLDSLYRKVNLSGQNILMLMIFI